MINSNPASISIVTINGDHPATLKTTNGCWDVSHIVINRGDASQNINGSIGYFSHSPLTYNDTIVISNTLPAVIIDASFPDVENQDYLGNNDERYFTVTTAEFIYLFSTVPMGDVSAEIKKVDSFSTPSQYVKSFYDGKNQLLVVSKQDSASYYYTSYSVPDFVFSNQVSQYVKPDIIEMSGSLLYLIVGDSAGEKKLLTLYTTSLQINYNANLPMAAENTKAVIYSGNYYYLIATPGDSITNIIQLNAINKAFNVINLFSNSGINSVTNYSEYPPQFLLQPSIDTSSAQVNRNLLMVDGVLGLATDTFHINKSIHSLHRNTSYGWGPYVYSVIMGCNDSASKDKVFFYPPWGLTDFDSTISNITPSWYGEDFRCYISTEQIEKNLSIEVNPNPATDAVLIQVNHLATGKTYKFEITNLEGKILWSSDILTKQEYRIPLQDLPSGVLILRVDAGTKVVTKKIIKQ